MSLAGRPAIISQPNAQCQGAFVVKYHVASMGGASFHPTFAILTSKSVGLCSLRQTASTGTIGQAGWHAPAQWPLAAPQCRSQLIHGQPAVMIGIGRIEAFALIGCKLRQSERQADGQRSRRACPQATSGGQTARSCQFSSERAVPRPVGTGSHDTRTRQKKSAQKGALSNASEQ